MVRSTVTTTSLGAAAAAAASSSRKSAERDDKNDAGVGASDGTGGGGSEAADSADGLLEDRPRPPRYSGTGVGGGGEASLKFLRVVKKLQTLKRVERIAKSKRDREIRHLNSVLSESERSSVRQGEMTRLFPASPSKASGMGDYGVGSDYSVKASNTQPPEGGGEATTTAEEEDEPPTSISAYLSEVIFGKGIVSAMLLAGPVAVLAVYLEWNSTCIFWLSFFTMIPLAAILGDFTEEVALHTNQTIGGLINATFGNAVELVVAIQALLANEIRVVQSSMLGSILSNLLLVLGGCFFFGGLRYKEQRFNATAASANIGLLALSGIALVLPTPFANYYELHDEHVLLVSRVAAVFLMFMYVQLLIFQLKTHADIFDDGQDSELAAVPFWVAGLGLLIVTIVVTIVSEFLVGSIDGFVVASGISRTFVGIIILPIVGNVVEHVSAVTVAMKNKMDLAMGVAVGSCTQISLFVIPLTVLVGWMTDRDMTLNFPPFEVTLFLLSVFTVSVVLNTATGNWLLGSLLMTTYGLIAVGFWFENVQSYR